MEQRIPVDPNLFSMFSQLGLAVTLGYYVMSDENREMLDGFRVLMDGHVRAYFNTGDVPEVQALYESGIMLVTIFHYVVVGQLQIMRNRLIALQAYDAHPNLRQVYAVREYVDQHILTAQQEERVPNFRWVRGMYDRIGELEDEVQNIPQQDIKPDIKPFH